MPSSKLARLFYFLIGLTLFTPLIVISNFWQPFESSKFIFFLFLIECIFPIYLFLVSQHPTLRPNWKQPFRIAFILFLVCETIAAVFGVDPWNSFFGNIIRMDGLLVWYHLFFFSLYLDYAFRARPALKKTYVTIFLIVADLSALEGCLQAIHLLPSTAAEFTDRASSTLGNPIFFASTLIIPFFLALDAWKKSTHLKQKIFYGLTMILCFTALFASETRGAIVGLLFGGILLGFFAWQKTSQNKKRKTILFLASLCVLSLFGFFGIRTIAKPQTSLYRFSHFTDDNISARLSYWGLALKGLRDAPLFGLGSQNFYRAADKYYTSNIYTHENGWPDKPHNMLLEILITGGITSFIAYLFLFLTAIQSYRKQQPIASTIIFAALLAYVVQNCFAFDTISSLEQLIVLFAFMTITTHPEEKNVESASSKWIWLSLCIPIAFVYFFLYPSIKEFTGIYEADTLRDTNPEQALNRLEDIEDLPFVYDIGFVADQEAFLQKTVFTKDSENNNLIKRASEDAIHSYQSTLNTHPLRAYYYNRASMAYTLQAEAAKTKIPPEAISLAERAIELAPARIEARMTLFEIYETNGETEKAFNLAKEIIQMAPTNARALWTLAIQYYNKGDKKIAVSYAIQSLDISTKNILHAKDLDWIITYETDHPDQDSKSVIAFVLEKEAKIEPNNAEVLQKQKAFNESLQ